MVEIAWQSLFIVAIDNPFCFVRCTVSIVARRAKRSQIVRVKGLLGEMVNGRDMVDPSLP
jgi:hypothetical protein